MPSAAPGAAGNSAGGAPGGNGVGSSGFGGDNDADAAANAAAAAAQADAQQAENDALGFGGPAVGGNTQTVTKTLDTLQNVFGLLGFVSPQAALIGLGIKGIRGIAGLLGFNENDLSGLASSGAFGNSADAGALARGEGATNGNGGTGNVFDIGAGVTDAGVTGSNLNPEIQAAFANLSGAFTEGAAAEEQSLLQALQFLQANNQQAVDSLNQNTGNALALQQPLIGVGDQGLNLFADNILNGGFDPGEFNFVFDENNPGFQFQKRQGNDTINARANARGLLNSGGRFKELSTYNQGLANTYANEQFQRERSEFDANSNRLQNLFTQQGALADIGIDARNRSSNLFENLGVNTARVFTGQAQQGSNIFGEIGQVQNEGIVGSADALSDGLLAAIQQQNADRRISVTEAGQTLAEDQQAKQDTADFVNGLITLGEYLERLNSGSSTTTT